YTKGLGRTKDSWFAVWEHYSLNLVYYKKGSETWGTPVATDCSTLVPVEEPPAPQTECSIYPNPASTHITVETQVPSQLSILNLNGLELLKQPITEPKTIIDISSLPNGVYFVRVMGEKTVRVGKFIKQ
ncbi:T9SS type A sorting domain-containing protein, partial [bacterium]|nr:T9SS type A sorting domain-containing protein [bacterium]